MEAQKFLNSAFKSLTRLYKINTFLDVKHNTVSGKYESKIKSLAGTLGMFMTSAIKIGNTGVDFGQFETSIAMAIMDYFSVEKNYPETDLRNFYVSLRYPSNAVIHALISKKPVRIYEDIMHFNKEKNRYEALATYIRTITMDDSKKEFSESFKLVPVEDLSYFI